MTMLTPPLKLGTPFLILALALFIGGCENKDTAADNEASDNIDNTSNTGTTIEKTGLVLASDYLQYATVCLDTTKNHSCSDEDASVKTQSGENGSFTLNLIAEQYQQYAIVAESNDTGNSSDEKLVLSTPPDKTAPGADDIVISPLTTLVQGYQQANLTLNAEAAETQIQNGIGISGASLFEDYLAVLNNHSQGNNKASTPANKTSYTQAQLDTYRKMNDVAQVATSMIQKAIKTVEDDAALGSDSIADFDIESELDSLISLISNSFVNKLTAVLNAIKSGSFNPSDVVDEIGLTIDLNTLDTAIASQEAINNLNITAESASIASLLSNTLNTFSIRYDMPALGELLFLQREQLSIADDQNSLIADLLWLESYALADGFQPDSAFVGTNSDVTTTNLYFDSAVNAWTPTPYNFHNNRPITLESDNSAIVSLYSGRANISADIMDISNLPLSSFQLPLDLNSYGADYQNTIPPFSFPIGSQMVNLNTIAVEDHYVLDENSFVTGIVPQVIANSFDDMMRLEPVDLSSQEPTYSIGCDSVLHECLYFELITTDLANLTSGSTGSVNYYLNDYQQGTNFMMLPSTGSWQILDLGGGLETLRIDFPDEIHNRLLTYPELAPETTGLIYSVFNDTMRKGYVTAQDTALPAQTAFNDTAADTVASYILASIAGPDAFIPYNTNTNDSFAIDLYQYDQSNNVFIVENNASFIRAAGSTSLPAAGETFDLSLNIYDSPGLLSAVEFDRITIDSVTSTSAFISGESYNEGNEPTGQPTDSGTLRINNNLLEIELSNANEEIRLKIVTIQPTTDIISQRLVNAVIFYTVRDFGNNYQIRASGVTTGTFLAGATTVGP